MRRAARAVVLALQVRPGPLSVGPVTAAEVQADLVVPVDCGRGRGGRGGCVESTEGARVSARVAAGMSAIAVGIAVRAGVSSVVAIVLTQRATMCHPFL